MNIEYISVNALIPYERNTKIHDDKQTGNIAESIRNYGFVQPLVIDKNNVVVIGHGRLLAAKKLKMKEVPCVLVDDLTEEQVKALRIVDNKTALDTGFDYDVLPDELADLDLSDFDFDFEDEFEDVTPEEHEKHKEVTQDRASNILNIGRETFEGVGKYDIPQLDPVYKMPEVKEWIGFNYVMSDNDPKGKGVHFFVDDYQFERVWNTPEKYIEKLRQYACVLTPDFSPYSDMPLATQIFNHYRKHWCGAYWQSNGITVIPTIRASMDERSLEYFLDGEPVGGVVAISTMWTGDQEMMDYFKNKEYKMMYEKLKPSKVLLYGKMVDGLQGDIEVIKSFTQQRFQS